MTHHNGLPGFDAWLTTQPTGDEVEPQARHLAEALQNLPDGSDEEIHNLALMLAEEEARQEAQASQDEAEEHAAESSREDSEDRFGDGPL